MTREEIKLALEQGERVRHIHFPMRWWIEQEGHNYKWENNHLTEIETFWKHRENEEFDKDWSIIEI